MECEFAVASNHKTLVQNKPVEPLYDGEIAGRPLVSSLASLRLGGSDPR